MVVVVEQSIDPLDEWINGEDGHDEEPEPEEDEDLLVEHIHLKLKMYIFINQIICDFS